MQNVEPDTEIGQRGAFCKGLNLHEKCGQGISGRLGKAGRKVLLFIVKKPQFYDFFFFVEPEADKDAGLKLFGELRQAV